MNERNALQGRLLQVLTLNFLNDLNGVDNACVVETNDPMETRVNIMITGLEIPVQVPCVDIVMMYRYLNADMDDRSPEEYRILASLRRWAERGAFLMSLLSRVFDDVQWYVRGYSGKGGWMMELGIMDRTYTGDDVHSVWNRIRQEKSFWRNQSEMEYGMATYDELH